MDANDDDDGSSDDNEDNNNINNSSNSNFNDITDNTIHNNIFYLDNPPLVILNRNSAKR